MIEKLRPNYPIFLFLGFFIVATALFFLTAGRDALIGVWVNKLFDGQTKDGLFQASQTADKVIGDFLKTWLFVGLSILKLGIGFAIATIVRHLRASGRAIHEAYSSAGVEGIEAAQFQEPWYGRWFTRLLFGGMLVVLFSLALTLWWNANTVLTQLALFDGRTSGTAWQTYLIIGRVLNPVINGVKFAGEGMLILGIASGLATIITNLSFQAQGLPFFTRRVFGRDAGPMAAAPHPYLPWPFLGFAVAGATLLALALLGGLAEGFFGGSALSQTFDGGGANAYLKVEGLLNRSIESLVPMGLGFMFFGILFLLLKIIQYLREFRQAFGDTAADLSGGIIPRKNIESPLWTTKLAPAMAIFGLFVVGLFFLSGATIRDLNFTHMLDLRAAGVGPGSAAPLLSDFQSALRLEQILDPILAAGAMVGIGALFTGIGLALVTIVVNLQATALLLPGGFAALITAARGEKVEPPDEELVLENPLSVAPWGLFKFLLVGEGFIFTGMFPVAILFAISTARRLGEEFAGRGLPDAPSGLFQSSFLATTLYDASLAAWLLFGIGVILFAIGMFFATIVGFVEARRMVIQEGVQSIVEGQGYVLGPPQAATETLGEDLNLLTPSQPLNIPSA